jgi:hypothetical protein
VLALLIAGDVSAPRQRDAQGLPKSQQAISNATRRVHAS